MGEETDEMDRKKMEVRARLEQQSQAKKKKGFMTPERKKKLRVKRELQCPMLSSLNALGLPSCRAFTLILKIVCCSCC